MGRSTAPPTLGRRTWAYTQFCEHYKRFAKSLKRSMRQHRRAGEKLFIDYAGPTLALADGVARPGLRRRHGRVQLHLRLRHRRSEHALVAGCAGAGADASIGGVPQLIVPDNPRALISEACRYEPKLNDTVRDFARHYGVSFLPARPFLPKDKATVESAVQVVTRWILARLRHTALADVHAADGAIAALLPALNERRFQKIDGSRASLFASLDAPALVERCRRSAGSGPPSRRVKVHIDYHVEVDGHRYSVPHPLVGLELEARITDALVEVLHRGQRVACHARSARRGGFTTLDEHMPAAHRAHKQWTPERLIHWGGEHRPEHRRLRHAAAAAVSPPRARLPQLPGPAQPGQALRRGAAGSRLRAGARSWAPGTTAMCATS